MGILKYFLKDANAVPTKEAQTEADSDSDLDEAPVGKVDVKKYGDNFKMVGGFLDVLHSCLIALYMR